MAPNGTLVSEGSTAIPATNSDRLERARDAAAGVPDPEIPVVTLADLGILRAVTLEGERVVVQLTPTYTGCPATEVIADQVREALRQADVGAFEVRLTLSPAWTTDWITQAGRGKLRSFGIAPPACAANGAGGEVAVVRLFPRAPGFDARPNAPDCPRCSSHLVERLSDYGSTPCKALYRCLSCREPFDYFKPY
ncbi:MAG: phenylacetate-CoA oxygenase subunit PaaJ [Burkholderiales bacterium]|nr:MAG: phenylacetate-CoA oxygenase subunit PaaJ [Burkholderiales bacterium]